AEPALGGWQIRQGRTEHISAARMHHCLIERTPGETIGGGRHGRTKDIQRPHGNLETFAGSPEQMARRYTAIVESDARQRMGRDRFDALDDLETRRIGEDDECGNASRTWRFAGTRKDGVHVRDAAV